MLRAQARSHETPAPDPEPVENALLDPRHRMTIPAMPYTYIVRCRDGSYYVGSTWDLDRRIADHNAGVGLGANYTRSRRPVVLVWSQHFDRVEEAFAFEKRVQGWGRAKREALIRGDSDAISALSRRKAVKDRATPGE